MAAHGVHITLAQPKLHIIDQQKANRWHGKRIEFEYGDIYIGGLRNGFVGFYMNIFSKELDNIQKDVMVKDNGKSYLHLSICTSKSLRK